MKCETLFLKLAVVIIGIPVLAVCAFLMMQVITKPVNPVYAPMLYPILAGMLASAVPFFAALYQAFGLLNLIDRNEAFSELSVKALKRIKLCAVAISTLYAAIMPFVYLLAEKDDAPGLILVGMVPIFASIVIAVFAAVLQKLLKNAIDIKSENDLTI